MNRAGWLRWARRSAEAWARRTRNRDTVFLLFTAAVVGLFAGLAAIAFGAAIHAVQRAAWGLAEPTLDAIRALPAWRVALVPALGGLCVGVVTTFFVAEAKGHGVPEVIRAVALGGAKIRGRVAFAKTLASALTIGSGGSAGREGPMIQIGAAIGSRVGRTLGMSKPRLRTLVACGSAAGIAATFNAPIAGALFSTEVILGEFGAARFGPVVIASVVATTVSRAYRGSGAVFTPPPCTVASPLELVPYALLGLACGLVSFLYIRANRAAEAAFSRLPKTRAARLVSPAVGGLLVGCLALVLPRVLGDGHALSNDAFSSVPIVIGHVPIPSSAPLVVLLLLLAAAKIVATSVTLGSGGSGGVFSPAIAIGALLGAVAGHAAAPLLGARFGGVAAYSLAGMSGLVAGSLMAPMTAILMVFEITSNYAIILPVMLVATLSTLLCGRLTGNLSIYTEKLAREGVRLIRNASPDLLRGLLAGDHARPGAPVAAPSDPASDLLRRLLDGDADALYVADPSSRLLGVVTLADVRKLLHSPASLTAVLLAEDLMRRDVPFATPDETLSSVLAKLSASKLPTLPLVLSPENPVLLGTLHESDLLAIYQHEMLKSDTAS
jgi:CIC family chloride channel protein